MKKDEKWNDYQEYLQSNNWRNLKEIFYKSFNNEVYCEICDTDFEGKRKETHHFQYSKNWNDDSIDNLVCVCRDCHRLIHNEFTKEDWIMGRWENKYHFLYTVKSIYLDIIRDEMSNSEMVKEAYKEIIVDNIINKTLKYSEIYTPMSHQNFISWEHINNNPVPIYLNLKDNVIKELTKRSAKDVKK